MVVEIVKIMMTSTVNNSPNDDLKDVCQKLDGLVIDVFDTLHQLLAAKSQLESHMREGYLYMAKARNVMGGASSVSSMQYCTDDLNRARVHVEVITSEAPDCTSASDQPQSSSHSVAGIPLVSDLSQVLSHSGTRRAVNYCFIPSYHSRDQSSTAEDGDLSQEVSFNEARELRSTDDLTGGISLGLRKRVTQKRPNHSTYESPPGGDEDQRNNQKINGDERKDLNKTTDAENTAGGEVSKETFLQSSKDPLLWFGVLVPQSLRCSQVSFVRAVELTFTVATLQAKLAEQRREFDARMKLKGDLSLMSGTAQHDSASVDEVSDDERYDSESKVLKQEYVTVA